MRLNLTGKQVASLRKALQTACTPDEFGALLRQESGHDVGLPAASQDAFGAALLALIRLAEEEGWTDKLVLGIATRRPDDPALALFAHEMGLSPASAINLAASVALLAAHRAGDAACALRRIVQRGAADIGAFLVRLGALQSRICRIEVNGQGVGTGGTLGTGILVGDDLVLTNYQVKHAVAANPAAVCCRFDERMLHDGSVVRPGQTVAVALRVQGAWCVADSAAGGGDAGEEDAGTSRRRLGYAVLRLDEPVAHNPPGCAQPDSNLKGRGAVSLAQAAAVDRSCGPEVFVLQLPPGLPLTLSMGLRGTPGELQRWLQRWPHDAPLHPLASGGLCFNADLELVAIQGAADAEGRPTAVAIEAIAADLEAKSLLG